MVVFTRFLLLIFAFSVLVGILMHPEVATSKELSQGSNPKPLIVLVHGTNADATSWQSVILILQQDGYTVTAVQNPLTALADDIAMTKRLTPHRPKRDGDS